MSATKKILASVIALGFLAPSLAFAQTSTTATSTQALLAQINALQTQIKALQDQQKALQQQQGQALDSLVLTLKEGSSGDQVAILQALLALDPSIYPEGKISGFFGRKTGDAVKRFQRKHGLEQAGRVGPKTLKKLNEMLREQDNDDNDDEDEDRGGKGKEKVVICHKGETKRVAMPSTFAHIRHGDTLGACGGTDGGTGTTNPDVSAPVITNAGTTGITHTAATIGWTTNEGATTQVEYGLTSSYTASTTLNTSLITSHSVSLTGLTAATTYHFRVLSKDAAGNASSSGDMTFVTTATPDTTAPVISSVSVSSIGSITATVNWTTNEAATGKVYYGITTPVNFGSFAFSGTAALSTAHGFNLVGLTANTTYYYAVESKDAANNTATTSTASFTTTI